MVDLRKGFSELFGKFNTYNVQRTRAMVASPERSTGESRLYRGAFPLYDTSPIEMPVSYPTLAKECYQRNPYVYACITHISRNLASVPWIVFKETAEGRDEVEDHPMIDLLNRPNPRQSWSAFMDNFVTDLMLSGNAFVFRAGPSDKPPEELYLLRPDRMRIVPGDKYNPVRGYIFDGTTFQVFYPAEIVCHIKLYNPTDDWYGMSPLMAAIASVRMHNEVQKWNFSLVKNMARPPAAITSLEVLDEEQYQRLRIMIEEMYSGPGNAGRPLILENGIDWKPLSLTPNEMNWQATAKLSASEIAMVLGVPGELIGANTTRAIGSTVQESRKAFYLETLLPMLDFIKSELNNWLSPLYPDHPTLEYNKDEMEALQEALQQRWSMLLQAYGSGVLSLNEVRYALGYEDIPGGDTPMALLQLLQMGGVMAQGTNGQPLDALSSAVISGVFSGAAPTNGQPAPQPQAQAAAGQPAMTAAPQQQQPGAPAPAPQQAAPAAGQPAQAAQPATTNAAAAPAQAAPGQQPTQAAPAEDMNSVPSIIKKLLGEENGAPEPTVSGKREKNEGLTDTQQPAQAAGQPAPQQPAANGGVNNAQ